MKQKSGKSKIKARPPFYEPPGLPAVHGACLHADLQKYLGYCFYKSAANIRAKVDQRFAPFGLVAPQFGMLIILQAQGAITQGELGQFMAIDKATMVRMIDGLEAKKLVTRVPSKTDRRANHLQITKAGGLMLLKLDAERKVAEEEFLSPLTQSERQQLVAIVSKLTSAGKS